MINESVQDVNDDQLILASLYPRISDFHVFVDTFSVFEPIHNNEFVERLVALQSSLSNIPDTD